MGQQDSNADYARFPPRTFSQGAGNLHAGSLNDRKPLPPIHAQTMRSPSSSVGQSSSSRTTPDMSRLSLGSSHSTADTPDTGSLRNSSNSIPPTQILPVHQRHIRDASNNLPQPYSAEVGNTGHHSNSHIGMQNHRTHVRTASNGVQYPPRLDSANHAASPNAQSYSEQPKLQYFHEPYTSSGAQQQRQQQRSQIRHVSNDLAPPPPLGMSGPNRSLPELRLNSDALQRPESTFSPQSAVEPTFRGREHSRHLSVGRPTSPAAGSPMAHGRNLSSHRYSPDSRPQSYVDLLQVPYTQQIAPAPTMDNSFLRGAVGANASLLDTRKTLDMYRANVKNMNEPAIQYEFAIFMVQAAMEATGNDRQEMLRESKAILQKLADRSYPFAQYYLADGYASGLFNKGKEDHDRAFPLFQAASKHGHAEAGYRAALCYEFGWGCRRDYAKATQFYRASASKNHPGAATRLGLACLQNSMGLHGKYKQGVSYLKRAAEAADTQYNAAPYELARLYEQGHGDDIFKDEAYAAQLYTRSAELGHADANLVMGKAYEHGLLACPKDAALSIHFYTGAAQAGIPEAMMALCAWYLFGAEPVLEKNENEAFEWARQAADLGYAKAEYAVGYFKEVGIGCRQDTLEANVWYVKAAQQGEERAKARLQIIRDAAAGGGNGGSNANGGMSSSSSRNPSGEGKAKKGGFKKFVGL